MTRAASMLASVLAVAWLAAGCGSGSHASSHSSTSTTTTTAPAQTTTSASTAAPAPSSMTTTSPAKAPRVSAPVGGPVPAGFSPISFTAVSDNEFWLLGTAPCQHPVCTSIVRTSNGGGRFVGIPAPVAPLSSDHPGPDSISQLRFVNGLDGYAYGTDEPDGGPLWQTSDGGGRWHRTLSGVLAFATASGDAFVVTGSCSQGRCSNLRLERAGVGGQAWSATAISGSWSAGPPLTLAAHGSSVWLSLTPATGQPRSQTLVYSTDAGRHVATRSAPCTPGLGGTLEPASTSALWAICPTGTEARAWRSTDGGAHWSAVGAPNVRLANSAAVAPANATTAVIATGNGSQLMLTTDGRVFNQVFAPGSGAAHWAFIGFTDPSTGSGLLNSGSTHAQLWRSTDGGVHWRGPVAVR